MAQLFEETFENQNSIGIKDKFESDIMDNLVICQSFIL
jgi:hypothetical protein